MRETTTRRDRVVSACVVAAVHGVIGYAFIAGLHLKNAGVMDDPLKVFDISEATPPPPEPIRPAPRQSDTPEGAAAPPGLKAQATQIVVPPPKVSLPSPPPIIAAPVAGQGSAPSQGAAPVPGPGTGAGGVGSGTGSGGSGSGTGSGGIAVKPQLISGRIRNSDYPRAARAAKAEGTVVAYVTVAPDGRVSQCRVARSSRNDALDTTTCTLIQKRFRYRPARDAEGRAISAVVGWMQVWWLGSKDRFPADPEALRETLPPQR